MNDFKIRPANISDMKNVFELSNDKLVRKNSINSNAIIWDEHVKWFNERLKKGNEPFYIIEDKNDNFIGQIKFDRKENNDIYISISISENYRGKHLASYLIKQCSLKTNFKRILSVIKKENIASLKAFQKSDYEIISQDNAFFILEFINTDKSI